MIANIQPHNNTSNNIAFQAKFSSRTVNKIPKKIRQNINNVTKPEKETFAQVLKNIFGEMFPTFDPQYKEIFTKTPRINRLV